MNINKEKLIEIIRHKKGIGRVDATDLGAEELAEQIIEADRLNNGKATSEAKEKYQILEFKQKSGIEDVWKQKNHNEWCRYHNEAFVTRPYTFNEILNHEQYYIHTVQYTSPSGETKVFTVGDKVTYKTGIHEWIIDNFFIRGDGEMLVRSKDCAN